MISMAASLLDAAGDRFRARVMGVRTLAVYGLPLGLMASGGLIERVGFPATISLYCAIGLVFTALIATRWRASVWHAVTDRRPAVTTGETIWGSEGGTFAACTQPALDS